MRAFLLLLLLAQDKGRDGTTVTGEILRIDGRSLTIGIKKDGGKTVEQAVKVDKDAEIVVDAQKGKFEDLKPGRLVRILMRGEAAIRIEAPKTGAEREGLAIEGVVARIDGRSLVISIRNEGKVAERSLPVDKEAAIQIAGAGAKLEDLKPGQAVRLLVRRDVVVRVEAARAAEEKPAPKSEVRPPPKPEEKPAPKVEEKPVAKPEPKPVEVKPARPFPIDETVVPKGEKLPDLGGRIVSVFPDGPMTLVTIRQVNEEVPFYIPKDASVTYVGLEKPDQKPTVGYLAYVWLKPNSKDTAAAVRLARR